MNNNEKKPNRTEIFGDYEYSKFIDNDKDHEYYTNSLFDIANEAMKNGHHEISDIMDVVAIAINTSRYRHLHNLMGKFIQQEQLEEKISLN